METNKPIIYANVDELAEYIAEGLGGGGGHLVKAGGFLKRDLIEKASIEYSSDCIHSMLLNRMNNYYYRNNMMFHMCDNIVVNIFHNIHLKLLMVLLHILLLLLQ